LTSVNAAAAAAGEGGATQGGLAMTNDELRRLADRLEGESVLDPETAARIAALIDAAFPGRSPGDGTQAALGSTDGVLGLLAEALPSWSVHITGHSATVAGRWTCTIRETGVRDDDELIGVGKAGRLSHAATAALLQVIALRAGR
jgi:hypothetical protein